MHKILYQVLLSQPNFDSKIYGEIREGPFVCKYPKNVTKFPVRAASQMQIVCQENNFSLRVTE